MSSSTWTLAASRRVSCSYRCVATASRDHAAMALSGQEYPPAFLDDLLIGAFLLYGAWRSSRDPVMDQSISQLHRPLPAESGTEVPLGHRYLDAPDPSGIPMFGLRGYSGAI
jgi:hypothetical protein